jgi:hypothetical protein
MIYSIVLLESVLFGSLQATPYYADCAKMCGCKNLLYATLDSVYYVLFQSLNRLGELTRCAVEQSRLTRRVGIICWRQSTVDRLGELAECADE